MRQYLNLTQYINHFNYINLVVQIERFGQVLISIQRKESNEIILIRFTSKRKKRITIVHEIKSKHIAKIIINVFLGRSKKEQFFVVTWNDYLLLIQDIKEV